MHVNDTYHENMILVLYVLFTQIGIQRGVFLKNRCNETYLVQTLRYSRNTDLHFTHVQVHIAHKRFFFFFFRYRRTCVNFILPRTNLGSWRAHAAHYYIILRYGVRRIKNDLRKH